MLAASSSFQYGRGRLESDGSEEAEHPCGYLRRRRGHAPVASDADALEAGCAPGRQVPARGHPDLELHQLGHPAHLRFDAVQLGQPEPPHRAHLPLLASMGIYVFKYEWLTKLLARDGTWMDFGKQVIPAAIQCCNVQAFMFDGYWEDIGTISAFHQANLDLTATIPKFNLFDTEAPIFTRARYLPPSKVNNCHINQSIISEGCIITRAVINRSLIGVRTRIDFAATTENTYIMGADYFQSIEDMAEDTRGDTPRIGIGEGAVIRNAIIDKNARIGAGVRLVNERGVEDEVAPDGSWHIRERIIIVPKNSVIPNGTVV